MGLFDFLRRLFGGSSTDTHAVESPVTAPPARGRARLDPLRYHTSLVRTAPDVERVDSTTPPYQFAHLCVDGRRYLDLSQDGDPRWLDHFGLPHLKTPQDLADFLNLKLGKLAWLIHRFDEGARPISSKSAHYHFSWRPKRSGGHRLIESPKGSLRHVQHRILREMLDKVPAHANAHGFIRGRSIITNARAHVGRRVLLKLDLQNFYASCRYARVVALYRALGYSRVVSLWLARLTTSAIPANLTFPGNSASVLRTYYPRHLPQGAPTSPALANLSAYSLDVRLSGLAQSFNVNYTRYADDLTFSGSGKFVPALRTFVPLVSQIVRSERFTVHRAKRQVLRNNQRQIVTGVVVNSRINVSRKDYDRLKAVLTNCIRSGPASQNRERHSEFAAHLAGRIAHIRQLNRARGAKLLELYERIDWSR